jgi:hypothetical protein
VKRTGRKRRRRPEQRRRPGPGREAAWPPRSRGLWREQRHALKIVFFVVLALAFLYFYDKAITEARRDCEARGGRLALDRSGPRCVFPGEPAAP